MRRRRRDILEALWWYDTYAELERGAVVKAHLVALTRAQVSEKLRQRGEPVHVRAEETDDLG